jgi:hypothetical protein
MNVENKKDKKDKKNNSREMALPFPLIRVFLRKRVRSEE